MISYIDTRGNTTTPQRFSDVVITGIAPGGGLYVPETIPTLTLEEIKSFTKMTYPERAAFVYKKFEVNFTDEEILALMKDAYGPQFDTEKICPVVEVEEGFHVLELFHGPTSAFKDMALQCLPRFFSASVKKRAQETGDDTNYLVLVATSGDTGKAALKGFANREFVKVCVLYPDGGVSDIQLKQMVTQQGDNVMVFGATGNFDDCQTTVKQVFGDPEFAAQLKAEHNMALTSANSINWGRLLPQIVYYISAYAELVKKDEVELGNPVDVCVPTGNFGNILAAYYAKRMGTPIERLFCASNENNVLTDFINTGTYDIQDRTFELTPSPSMDILISSNLERQLFELTDRDADKINGWMQELKENKKYKVDKETFRRMRQIFNADFCTNDECLETINRLYESKNYLMDPHTAVAYEVATRLAGDNPVIIASTAHWAKFGFDVYRALNGVRAKVPLPQEVADKTGAELNRIIANETHEQNIPENLDALDKTPRRFTEVITPTKEACEKALLSWLNED